MIFSCKFFLSPLNFWVDNGVRFVKFCSLGEIYTQFHYSITVEYEREKPKIGLEYIDTSGPMVYSGVKSFIFGFEILIHGALVSVVLEDIQLSLFVAVRVQSSSSSDETNRQREMPCKP